MKVGFSWTSFFFGGFPFFFRGMPAHGLGWLVLSVVTFGISNLILCFIINKQTAIFYLENGYSPVGDGWQYAATEWGVYLKQPPANERNDDETQKNEESSVTKPIKVDGKKYSPAPLIAVGIVWIITGCLSVYTSLLRAEGFSIGDIGLVFTALSLMRLGTYIWVAISFLEKLEHRAIVIVIFILGYFAPLLMGMILEYT